MMCRFNRSPRPNRPTLSALLPSPLWGGIRGGWNHGRTEFASCRISHPHSVPPSPALPHKRGGWRALPATAIFGAFFMSGFAPAVAHPPPILSLDQEKSAAEEVVAFREEIQKIIASKDAAKLRDLYAPSFVHTHGSGRQDGRDTRIVSILAGDPIIETAPVEDLVIRMPGGWTAVVTGKSPVKSLADGKTYKFAWIAVYVRTDKSWQIAASQATRLEEVKP